MTWTGLFVIALNVVFFGTIVLWIGWIIMMMVYAAVVQTSEWAVKTAKGILLEFTPLLPESWTSEEQKRKWAFAYLYTLYVKYVGKRAFRLYGSETVWHVSESRVSLSPGRERLVFEWVKRGDPACIHLRDMWKGRDPGGLMGDVIDELNRKFAEPIYSREKNLYA